MNSDTNTPTSAIAASIAALIFWLLGHYMPDLMATAPDGLEAGLAGLIVVLIGYLTPNSLLSRRNR